MPGAAPSAEDLLPALPPPRPAEPDWVSISPRLFQLRYGEDTAASLTPEQRDTLDAATMRLLSEETSHGTLCEALLAVVQGGTAGPAARRQAVDVFMSLPFVREGAVESQSNTSGGAPAVSVINRPGGSPTALTFLPPPPRPWTEGAARIASAGLADVWSAVRKLTAARLGPVLDGLGLPEAVTLIRGLVAVCRCDTSPWQAVEGAVVGIAAALRRFKWERVTTPSATTSSSTLLDNTGGAFAETKFVLRIGGDTVPVLPAVVSDELPGVLYGLLAHRQLSIRDAATRAFAAFFARSPFETSLVSLVDIIARLLPDAATEGPHPRGGAPTRIENGPNGALIEAFEAEGLLSVALLLIRMIPPAVLLPNLRLYFATFERYLEHPASTVRQVTSSIYRALATKDSANPVWIREVLQGLAREWETTPGNDDDDDDDDATGGDGDGTDIGKNDDDRDDGGGAGGEKVNGKTLGGGGRAKGPPGSWQGAEGRLLAYELIFRSLLAHHLEHLGLHHTASPRRPAGAMGSPATGGAAATTATAAATSSGIISPQAAIPVASTPPRNSGGSHLHAAGGSLNSASKNAAPSTPAHGSSSSSSSSSTQLRPGDPAHAALTPNPLIKEAVTVAAGGTRFAASRSRAASPLPFTSFSATSSTSSSSSSTSSSAVGGAGDDSIAAVATRQDLSMLDLLSASHHQSSGRGGDGQGAEGDDDCDQHRVDDRDGDCRHAEGSRAETAQRGGNCTGTVDGNTAPRTDSADDDGIDGPLPSERLRRIGGPSFDLTHSFPPADGGGTPRGCGGGGGGVGEPSGGVTLVLHDRGDVVNSDGGAPGNPAREDTHPPISRSGSDVTGNSGTVHVTPRGRRWRDPRLSDPRLLAVTMRSGFRGRSSTGGEDKVPAASRAESLRGMRHAGLGRTSDDVVSDSGDDGVSSSSKGAIATTTSTTTGTSGRFPSPRGASPRKSPGHHHHHTLSDVPVPSSSETAQHGAGAGGGVAGFGVSGSPSSLFFSSAAMGRGKLPTGVEALIDEQRTCIKLLLRTSPSPATDRLAAWRLAPFRDVLVTILRGTCAAIESPQFELRRISSQVLPALAEIALWFDLAILREEFWEPLLRSGSDADYAAWLTVKYAVRKTAQITAVLTAGGGGGGRLSPAATGSSVPITAVLPETAAIPSPRGQPPTSTVSAPSASGSASASSSSLSGSMSSQSSDLHRSLGGVTTHIAISGGESQRPGDTFRMARIVAEIEDLLPRLCDTLSLVCRETLDDTTGPRSRVGTLCLEILVTVLGQLGPSAVQGGPQQQNAPGIGSQQSSAGVPLSATTSTSARLASSVMSDLPDVPPDVSAPGRSFLTHATVVVDRLVERRDRASAGDPDAAKAERDDISAIHHLLPAFIVTCPLSDMVRLLPTLLHSIRTRDEVEVQHSLLEAVARVWQLPLAWITHPYLARALLAGSGGAHDDDDDDDDNCTVAATAMGTSTVHTFPDASLHTPIPDLVSPADRCASALASVLGDGLETGIVRRILGILTLLSRVTGDYRFLPAVAKSALAIGLAPPQPQSASLPPSSLPPSVSTLRVPSPTPGQVVSPRYTRRGSGSIDGLLDPQQHAGSSSATAACGMSPRGSDDEEEDLALHGGGPGAAGEVNPTAALVDSKGAWDEDWDDWDDEEEQGTTWSALAVEISIWLREIAGGASLRGALGDAQRAVRVAIGLGQAGGSRYPKSFEEAVAALSPEARRTVEALLAGADQDEF